MNLPYSLIPTNRPYFGSVKYCCKFNENSITLTLERVKDGLESFDLRVYSNKSHNQSLAIGLSLRLMMLLLFLSELISIILQVRREVAFLTVEGQSTAWKTSRDRRKRPKKSIRKKWKWVGVKARGESSQDIIAEVTSWERSELTRALCYLSAISLSETSPKNTISWPTMSLSWRAFV